MILLIDGSNLVFRNFHVFEHLSNHMGYLTGAVYGFFNALLPYSYKYSKIIVAWEGQNNWRKKIYPEYKNNRREKEPEKIQSLLDVKELCDYCGIIQISKDGFEADDVISFLVRKFQKDIRILSGDKDLLQFIDDDKNISVFRPHPRLGTIEYTESSVQEFVGIPKKYISLFLSIVGDDNIQGVKGWGKVKAANLINKEQEPLEFIKHAYSAHYKIVQRNLELIDLINPKEKIEKLDHQDIKLLNPNKYLLNQKLDEYEIEAYTCSTLIESLCNLDFQQQCKSILLS
jgi:5'-3' exonuclease